MDNIRLLIFVTAVTSFLTVMGTVLMYLGQDYVENVLNFFGIWKGIGVPLLIYGFWKNIQRIQLLALIMILPIFAALVNIVVFSITLSDDIMNGVFTAINVILFIYSVKLLKE